MKNQLIGLIFENQSIENQLTYYSTNSIAQGINIGLNIIL